VPSGTLAAMYFARRAVPNASSSALMVSPRTPHRRIERNPFEPAREVARKLGKTRRYRQSRNDRKKVEVLFAHMKRILRVDRLRLRGRSGAHDEFLLTAIAQNLRRLAITFNSRSMEPVRALA
jgi:Transposase DDE domain